MTDLELLSRRVLELETRYRRIKRVVLVACVMISAGVLMAQVRGIPGEVLPAGRTRIEAPPAAAQRNAVEEEVRSRHFILVDEKGKERASLVADGAGSVKRGRMVARPAGGP